MNSKIERGSDWGGPKFGVKPSRTNLVLAVEVMAGPPGRAESRKVVRKRTTQRAGIQVFGLTARSNPVKLQGAELTLESHISIRATQNKRWWIRFAVKHVEDPQPETNGISSNAIKAILRSLRYPGVLCHKARKPKSGTVGLRSPGWMSRLRNGRREGKASGGREAQSEPLTLNP